MTESKFPIFLERGDQVLASEAELPPVVARLVVEIRSDGTRTVARGAIVDQLTGESAALRIEAKSPLALAAELSKSLLKVPAFNKATLTSLLPNVIKSRLRK